MNKNINFTVPGFIAYNLLWIASVACFAAYGKRMKKMYDKTFITELVESGKFDTADLLLTRLKRQGKITDTEWKMYQDALEDELKFFNGTR